MVQIIPDITNIAIKPRKSRFNMKTTKNMNFDTMIFKFIDIIPLINANNSSYLCKNRKFLVKPFNVKIEHLNPTQFQEFRKSDLEYWQSPELFINWINNLPDLDHILEQIELKKRISKTDLNSLICSFSNILVFLTQTQFLIK